MLLGVACGLTAVYVLLFFSTLAAEGLGGFFLLVEYTFWVGVAGVILVIVAFFFGWLPYHEWWMVSAVAAWVLVPIVGGFFAALAILWGFESLYASPEFATWYRGAAGGCEVGRGRRHRPPGQAHHCAVRLSRQRVPSERL